MIDSLPSISGILAQATQYGSDGGGGGGIAGLIFLVIWLALVVLIIAGGWKMFAKAGQPGWLFIIPIVNLYFMLKIAGRPGWWLILYLIPIVNLVISIIVAIDLSKAFGRGVGTAIGLIFLPVIFIPILGFGSAAYQGPAPTEVGGPLDAQTPATG